MSELGGVDEDNRSRRGNERLDNWASKRLMNIIEYKARECSIEVGNPGRRWHVIMRTMKVALSVD